MEVQDVNRLIKQFREAQKVMKMFQKTGGKGWESCLGSMKLKVSFLPISPSKNWLRLVCLNQ